MPQRERYYAQERPPTRRRPLTDATSRLNSPHPQPSAHVKAQRMPLSPQAKQNEPRIPADEVLRLRNDTSPHTPQSRHAVGQESSASREPKRNSAISNASTDASGPRRKSHIGPWQLGKTIGRGGCSRVRVVRHSVTGQIGAAKIISKSTAESVRALSLANLINTAKQDASLYPDGKPIPFGLEREIVIMKLLDHQNIVKLYDVWENRNEIYIIMEYVPGGELFNYISERRGLDEDEAIYLFRQIVAALLYCHRINIHHRDLKPENILLDQNTHNLKLVDFGMAALQPVGKYLSTPCGSPHYAAPEVIRTKSYDGSKSDVWSCGVILFVMLAGYPPFNYTGDDRDLNELFRSIAHADYIMPDGFSREAKDLIRRILVPDPQKRLGIENVWHHPLLHKYDAQFGTLDNTIESQIGPCPSVEDWELLTRQSIDREILRNMRTLWHSELEETLIQKLLSHEPNQEKYFYGALLKHRNDQLENLVENSAGVIPSASDHHHARPRREIAQIAYKRTNSQFTILNNEHLYSKHSFYEPPSSEASYDPFRASRDPIVAGKPPYVNIAVHRGSSGASASRRGNSLHPSSSLRVQAALRRSSIRRSSVHSSLRSRTSSARHNRSISRLSTASSIYPSSPPVAIKARGTYRRGVSFQHLRNSSAGGTPVANAPTSPTEHITVAQPSSIATSSPLSTGSKASPHLNALPQDNGHFGRPPSQVPRTPGHRHIRYHKHKSQTTPSVYIDREARKVSTELNKLCEQAFFRTSVDSPLPASVEDKTTTTVQFDTPSSAYTGVYSTRITSSPLNVDAFQNRPLPPVPSETPNTFIAREIAETRARLAKRYEEEGNTTANFNEVLAHLDRLLQPTASPSPSPPVSSGKRAASAPQTAKPSDYATHLPMISEEGRALETYGEGKQKGMRSVTDPFTSTRHPRYHTPMKSLDPQELQDVDNEYDTTIRVVAPSSSTIVAPLNIRKRSGATVLSQITSTSGGASSPKTVYNSAIGTITNGSHRSGDATDVLNELSHTQGPDENVGQGKPGLKKKRSWLFSRKGKEKQIDEQPVNRKIPAAWADLDDRMNKITPSAKKESEQLKHKKRISDQPSAPSNSSSEFPMRDSQRQPPRKGFLKFLNMFASKPDPSKLVFDSPNNLSTSSFNSIREVSRFHTGNRPVEYQRNWLSRFLHMKPATHTLCFRINRGRARQELVRLLRDWKRFGVRDVGYDRESNTIAARIGKDNHLSIKPVSFVIELFVVLEHGKRAGLCLARWTQTKGAASSFRKVSEIVEEICKGRGLLVMEEERKAAMRKVLEE